MIKKNENIFLVFILLFFILTTLLSLSYLPKARLFPLIIGAIGIVIVCFKILINKIPDMAEKFEFLDRGMISFKDIRENFNLSTSKNDTTINLSVLNIYIWLIGYAALMYLLSPFYGTVIFLFLFLFFKSNIALGLSLKLVVSMGILIYLIFNVFLGVR